jgi:hypothetical protein
MTNSEKESMIEYHVSRSAWLAEQGGHARWSESAKLEWRGMAEWHERRATELRSVAPFDLARELATDSLQVHSETELMHRLFKDLLERNVSVQDREFSDALIRILDNVREWAKRDGTDEEEVPNS